MHNEVLQCHSFLYKKEVPFHKPKFSFLDVKMQEKWKKNCIPDSKVEFLVQKYECDIRDYS